MVKDPVSAALLERAREPRGFAATTVASALVHLLAVALLVFVPAQWRAGAAPERDVMTISLGGAPGPRAGGMTAMGGQAVQQAVPQEPRPRPAPPAAPAQRAPEMVEPVKAAPKPAQKAEPEAPRPVLPEPAGRTPTRGAEVRQGSAIAQTGGAGIGFGLSTGGGGTGGEFNVGDFCCPEYLQTMLQIIQRNWNPRQQIAGATAVRFTILRDGSVTGVSVAKPSGFAVLDLNAQRAISMSRMPPLPGAYPNPELTITLTFEYQR